MKTGRKSAKERKAKIIKIKLEEPNLTRQHKKKVELIRGIGNSRVILDGASAT